MKKLEPMQILEYSGLRNIDPYDIEKEIIEWYLSILNSDAKYVVFLNRTTYNWALLLEKETGKKMIDDKSKKYLTIPSLIEHIVNDIGKLNTYGLFTSNDSILICDALALPQDAREINRLYQNLLTELENQGLKEDDINTYLRRNLHINCLFYTSRYNDTNAMSFLDEHLFFNIRGKLLKMENPYYRRYMLQEPMYMLENGYFNQNSYYEYIPEEKFNQIKSNDWKKYIYHNIEEYTKVELIKDLNNKVYGISTIRLVKSSFNSGCYAIPEIFIPNLDEEESKKIVKVISSKMNDQDKDLIDKLFKSCTKQGFCELITFIMNQAILNEFNLKYNIDIDESFKEELITRLSRNYNYDDFEISKNRMTNLINNPIITNIEELTSILTVNIPEKKAILLDNNIFGKTYFDPRIYLEDFFIKEVENIDIEKRKKGIKDLSHFKTYHTFLKIEELIKEIPNDKIEDLISYLLLMNDSELISISSFLESNKEGYERYIKAEDNVTALKALRVMHKNFSGKSICDFERTYMFSRHCRSILSFTSIIEIFSYVYGLEIDKKEGESIENYLFECYPEEIKEELEANCFEYSENYPVFNEYLRVCPFKKDHNNDIGNVLKISNRSSDFFDEMFHFINSEYFAKQNEKIMSGQSEKNYVENVKQYIKKQIKNK